MNVAKILIDRHKLTQEEIGYRVGVSSTAVYHWYKGNRKPIPAFRKRLDELLAEVKARNGKKEGSDK